MHLKKSRHFLLLIIMMGLGLTFLVASDIISPEKTTTGSTLSSTSDTDQVIPLIYHMSFMSRYTQKLYFAGEAENWELADLYSHEVEEIGEVLAEQGYEYHGIDVGELVSQMMLPQIEKVEDAIDAQDPRLFAENYQILIDSCNSCHIASEYEIIKVAIPEVNPYAQDFSVQE
jgi:hypothetical protein